MTTARPGSPVPYAFAMSNSWARCWPGWADCRPCRKRGASPDVRGLTRMYGRDRPEPGLGRLDDIDTHVDRRRAAATHARHRPSAHRDGSSVRAGLWILVGLVIAGAVAVFIMRDELRLAFPGSETRELLNAAARA